MEHHLTDLPTGVVTFLFTDIEGSTQIAQALGDRFDSLISDHNQILRSAIEANSGIPVSTEGDSFFAVFVSPTDAVKMAIFAQGALAAHPWPDEINLRVRMGAHTGEGRLGGDNYAGIDVIKAARISAAAHGGQIVISETTRTLLDQRSFEVLGLGSHRMKGLDNPETLYQLVGEGLDSDFAPLDTESGSSNLPNLGALFVGRETETNDVVGLLEHHRLVTLTGVGGTGKTQLGIHVAGLIADRFPGGVYLVRLEALDDARRVSPTIASTVGASIFGDPVEAVAERIGRAATLLLLDNFEQVLPAVSDITRLLELCPGLNVLVTSQKLLRSRLEQVYPVPTLGLPSDTGFDGVESSDSVKLFIRRVTANDPSFELTKENASTVAEIVTKLDGHPLAIELAAARVRLFGLDGLNRDLATKMSSLSGGSADSPRRHQSLQQAVDWSYRLLEPRDQALLSRASVFYGGFDLDAAEAICGGERVNDVVGSLANLLDSSLVSSSVATGSSRFRLLEPIRAHGWDRVQSDGEADEVSRTHAHYYTSMAAEASKQMRGPDTYAILHRLRDDRYNLAAALDWSAQNDPDFGLSALPVMAQSFEMLGALNEGVQIAARLLNAGGSSSARLAGLIGGAHITYWFHDFDTTIDYYNQAIDLARQIGDSDQLGEAQFGQAATLAWVGRFDEAEAMANAGLVTFQGTGDQDGIDRIRGVTASIEWIRGDVPSAAKLMAESLRSSRRHVNVRAEIATGLALSGILLWYDEVDASIEAGLDGMHRYMDLHDESGMVQAVDWLSVGITRIDPQTGAVVAGAVEALKKEHGGGVDISVLHVGMPREVATASLGAERVEELWTKERHLDINELASYVGEWATGAGYEPKALDVEALLARSE